MQNSQLKPGLIRIFIGYDPREEVAYHVLSRSIIERSSLPVSITPVRLSHLNGIMTREHVQLQSTDFSFSRFLAPWLCNYDGWAIFMDCDMLVLDDIAKLWAQRNDDYSVMCVKHDHQPKEEVKFLGAVQTKYEKKNWSSVMLFNCAKCTNLTQEYVNSASGLELHQFKWLSSDDQIGAIPDVWNHLVGYQPPRKQMSLVHYTIGGPYFDEYQNCEYGAEWFAERDAMLFCAQRGSKDA